MATVKDSTIPLALRARIMRRAWEIFRARFNYPATPFRSIGRHCFVWAMKAAWNEAKQIARLAEHGAERLKSIIASLSVPKGRIGITTRFWEDADAMVERHRQIRLYTAALDIAVLP